MVFVVGGSSQGKLKCARTLLGEEYLFVNHYHEMVKMKLRELWSKNCREDAERMIEAMAEQFLTEKKAAGQYERLVIISDELGCGLVPVDAFEREYREINGRINCYFAREAEQVIRVVCGIGNRIKG